MDTVFGLLGLKAAVISGRPFDDNEPIAAWEQIEAGRFMPRRIRGSYRGGKLG